MILRLIDHNNTWRHYLLNPDNGDFEVAAVDRAADPTLEASGFGQIRTIGLVRNRRKTLVAIYTDRGRLWLLCEKLRYDLSKRGVRAKVKAIAPFVRRFRLVRRSEVLLSLLYCYHAFSTWPDDGDIFSLAARATGSEEDKDGYVSSWTAMSRGECLAPPPGGSERPRVRRGLLMILAKIDRWYKLFFCNAELRPYETACLLAWKKHLSEETRLRLEGQLSRFDYVERLAGEKKVNFWSLKEHRAPCPEELRFSVSTDEQTMEVATVWLRRQEPRSRARLRADMIVGNGEFFSIVFNKPPLAYFGIDKKSPVELIIDEVLIRHDLMHREAPAVPLTDTGRLEGWLAAWHSRWHLSEVLEPPSEAEREKLLSSFDTMFPQDYLEAVTQVGSFRVRNCKLFGLPEVEKIVHPDQNFYVIAEVEDRAYIGVPQGAKRVEIYELHFEFETPELYDSTSIRAVLEREMEDSDD